MVLVNRRENSLALAQSQVKTWSKLRQPHTLRGTPPLRRETPPLPGSVHYTWCCCASRSLRTKQVIAGGRSGNEWRRGKRLARGARGETNPHSNGRWNCPCTFFFFFFLGGALAPRGRPDTVAAIIGLCLCVSRCPYLSFLNAHGRQVYHQPRISTKIKNHNRAKCAGPQRSEVGVLSVNVSPLVV